jgi:hypothetical protein
VLDITNIALGLCVAVLLIFLAIGVIQEFIQRRRNRRRAKSAERALRDSLSELGITMRDGGEQLKKDKK